MSIWIDAFKRTVMLLMLPVCFGLFAGSAFAQETEEDQQGADVQAAEQVQETAAESPADTAQESEPVFETLFDGTSLDNFRSYSAEEIGQGWSIEDGALKYDGSGGGDIMTRGEYDNFELRFDWKVTEGANSGVMFRVSTGDNAPYVSGAEFQILDDDNHPDGQSDLTSAGSLYAMYAPQNGTLQPVGEWNTARIVLNGNHVEHWVNETKVVEAEIGSDDWNERLAASKFSDWEKFAKNSTGHICFQDHGNEVYFRNIMIRSLNKSGDARTDTPTRDEAESDNDGGEEAATGDGGEAVK